MSLSNISKTHLNELMKQSNDLNINHNIIENLKSDQVNYAKLKLIYNQMEYLKNQALEIINDSEDQTYLQNVACNCKKVSGNYYYLYIKNHEPFFSLIGPDEWNHNYIFKNKYYYDYDKLFVKNEIN